MVRSSIMIVATAGGVYISRDSGQTWALTRLPAKGAWVVASNPRCKRQFLVGYAGEFDLTGSDGIFLTNDGGTQWTSIGDAIKLNPITSIAFSPTARKSVYVSTYGRGVFEGHNHTFAACDTR